MVKILIYLGVNNQSIEIKQVLYRKVNPAIHFIINMLLYISSIKINFIVIHGVVFILASS